MDQATPPPDLFQGESLMGPLLRAVDWSRTPLGAVESWSPALRTTVRILLANRFPLLLWWGPEYIQLYNDAYRPIPGAKHPKALGQPARECWAEIWHILGPLIDTPFRGGPATWMEDIPLEINRYGYVEETHFTIAYSPVPDETVPTGIGGVLATVHEITEKVIGERRVVALRDLARAAEARTAEEACAIAARTLAGHDKDVPFALFYLLDADCKRARLAGAAGVGMGEAISPLLVDLGGPGTAWPLAKAIEDDAPLVVERLSEQFSAVPPGPWLDPPSTAVVLPIPSNKQHQPLGLFVAGVSERLRLNESYRGFLELVTGQVATAIANARVHEEERKRAEALAEIDRAKTLFFSNVSHEFRTPLTLMLGPLEDALRSPAKGLTDQNLEAAHRNALRLLRLVNALLDFSRIEAGRLQAKFEPVDLARVTADVAGVFRSAIERAGLRFRVECGPLTEAVYVDLDLWEKIVLNLLSNALKFTFDGTIELRLQHAGDRVELAVRDTGTGIAECELSRLFERFHRIEGAKARTHEGSGIGLALVRELVRMHGGNIRVASTHGHGTTFTITLPFGKTHLPANQVSIPQRGAPRASAAVAFVEEALLWLPSVGDDQRVSEERPTPRTSVTDARILIVDDNRDMRQYLERVLSEAWTVETAGDGEEALAALHSRDFDVVLTDVMMPRLDGFGLLRSIRATPKLSSLPVVMLSARTEEDARIEGLAASADDYLIKPFSARELLARVNTQLELSRARRHKTAERDRLQGLLSRVPATVNFLSGPDLVFQFAHPETIRRLGGRDVIGKPLLDAIPEYRDHPFPQILRAVLETGEPFSATEVPARLDRDGSGNFEDSYWNVVYQPVRSASGTIDGVMTFDLDVTDQVLARRKIEEQSAALEEALQRANEGDHRKNQFLATLAHELRGPLGPLMNSLEIMKRADADADLLERARAMMERQVLQMKRLIDDLLDVSRIARNQLEITKAHVNLGLVLEHAVEASRPACEAAGHTLTITPLPEPLYLEADPVRLTQVFDNLFTNACKYTDPGGRIDVAVERQGSDVVVRVADNGIGIPPDLLAKVFERFVQVDRSEARAQGGLGIGLALVKQLVELHGGTITAHSEGPGRGSEFIVRLPILTSLPVVHDPTPAPGQPIQASAQRILLVDDDRDSVESLALLLSLAGYETKTAYDGVDAIKAAGSYRPDVILLDIGLPKMSGYDVCRTIRAEPWGKDMVVIAITGWGHEDDRRRTAEAGFTAHLVKPVDHANLMKLLANAPDDRAPHGSSARAHST